MAGIEQTLQRYLLDEMPEGERSALEQEYFNDQQLFEQMVQVENELVDKYARGLLPPSTRDRFEKHYLAHSNRRDRAKFAEALAAKIGGVNEVPVATTPVLREPWWARLQSLLRGPKLAWALSLAILFMAAVAAWSLIETRRLRQELARAETDRTTREQRASELQQQLTNEQQHTDQLSDELERLRSPERAAPPAATSRFASLVLTLGGTRVAEAGPPAVLVIPEGAEQVRLHMKLGENDYPSYRAALQPAGGAEIFSWKRVTVSTTKSGPTLTLVLSAGRFADGDYILTLRGVSRTGDVEDVSKSLFRVERK